MTDTTNTNELTEQSEKQQATPSLAELDLRDYFAAKAMQSLIAKHGFISGEINFAAEHSYEIADAMLKAREASND